jgi:hypothetical protein
MGLRLAVAEQEPIKSDEQYMDMPVAVFRRTVETQVQKDVRALKELASRPTVQVQTLEEKAPAELPPSLAAILGACGPLSLARAHAWQTQHTRMCTLTPDDDEMDDAAYSPRRGHDAQESRRHERPEHAPKEARYVHARECVTV